jgi:gamma-glutamyltranspeptidase/glutathione hydrolase
MGGHHQPQGHVQVVRGLVDSGLDPQAVLDLPRWHWREGLEVDLESGWSDALIRDLEARGHRIHPGADASIFGRGQILLRNSTGLVGGSDRRADGAVRFR